MKKPKVSFGTIYRRGKKGIFYFENRKQGVNPSSLKTSDPDEAVACAIDRFAYLQFQDEARQQEYILHQLQNLHNHLRHNGSSIALDEIEAEFLISLRRTGKAKGKLHVDASSKLPLSPTTILNYKSKINGFQKWLKKNYPSIQAMHQVTAVVADRYMSELRDRLKAKTYNAHLSCLLIVWDRLSIKGGIDKNPFSKIKRIPKSIIRVETISKAAFSLADLEKIFNHFKGSNWEVVCRIAYETGLRLGDICHLQCWQIKAEDCFIDMRKGTRKSGKEHLFYVPNCMPLIKMLIESEKLNEDDYLFSDLLHKYKKGTLSKTFIRILDNIGINSHFTLESGRRQSKYGFHSFRATHATYLAESGVSVDLVKESLGHSELSTTKGYIHENDETIMAKIIAEHQALPLAGGNAVSGIIIQLDKMYQKLQNKDQELLLLEVSQFLKQRQA